MALLILGAISGCSNPRNIVDVVGQLLNVKISALDSDQVGFTPFRSVSEEEGAGTICSRCRRCSVFWYSGWAMPPTLAHISLLCRRAAASCDFGTQAIIQTKRNYALGSNSCIGPTRILEGFLTPLAGDTSFLWGWRYSIRLRLSCEIDSTATDRVTVPACDTGTVATHYQFSR